VLGGLLVADEVIDIFLPVLYFSVQKWRWTRLHSHNPLNGDGRVQEGGTVAVQTR